MIPFLRTTLDFITCYSLFIIVFVLFWIFGYRCWSARRRPGLEKIVVLFALAQGLNFASSVFFKAFKITPNDQDSSAGLLIGALVICTGAAYGVYDVIKSIEPRYTPKKIKAKRVRP